MEDMADDSGTSTQSAPGTGSVTDEKLADLETIPGQRRYW
jgi:hypothetical protein